MANQANYYDAQLRAFVQDAHRTEARLMAAIRELESLGEARRVPIRTRRALDDIVLDLKAEAARIGDTLAVYGYRAKTPVPWLL